MSFLVAHHPLAVGPDGHSIGGSKAVAEDLRLCAIGRDSDQRAVMRDDRVQGVAGRFREIEVAVGIGFQARGKLVKVFGHLMIVVEILVEIGFAVAIQVVEASDLIAAADIDLLVDDLQPQRLEQTGGDSLPGQLIQISVNPRDHPDVTVPRAEGGSPAVGKEVEPAEAQPRLPRVLHRRGDRVDHVGPVVFAQRSSGCEPFRPTRRSPVRSRIQVRRPVGITGVAHNFGKSGQLLRPPSPDEQFRLQRSRL